MTDLERMLRADYIDPETGIGRIQLEDYIDAMTDEDARKLVAEIARNAGFPPPKTIDPKVFLKLSDVGKYNFLRAERLPRRLGIAATIGGLILLGWLIL